MAIVRMQKLGICAGKKHRKAILEALQSMGGMEIFTDQIEDGALQKMDTASRRVQFERSADAFEKALKLLSFYAPEKGLGISALTGKKEIEKSRYDDIVSQKREYKARAWEVNQAEKEISELKGMIVRDENQITSLIPWLNLDIPMNTKGTGKTSVLIGTISGVITEAELYGAATKDVKNEAVSATVLSSSGEMSCVVVICLKADEEKVEEGLRARGFTKLSQPVSLTPKQETERLRAEIEQKKLEIEQKEAEIVTYADQKEGFRIMADYYRTRAEKYRLLATIPQSAHVFFMEGWVTADTADEIKHFLETKFDAYVEMEETREDDAEPTVLKNNRFSQSVEGVLESYGLPTKGHVDPTFVMSFFYVFFFGMMLSDGGYGLVMAGACGFILLKYRQIESGMKQMMKLFFWCGLSTAFWGFMYGGFFGDLIDVTAQTFFGYTGTESILKPLWFEPLANPMRLLVWCMLFGLIHLFTGLGMKGYELLRQHDFVGFVSDIVSWYLFLFGLILMLLPSSLFSSIAGMTFTFPAWMGSVAQAMTLVGVVIILMMSGRPRKNWALRIALGAYDLYGVTSWLSDVLSYSRLLALGLATGVIGSVINMMAAMAAKGKGVFGAVLYVVILIVGHTLNIGINALGAYVHTNRLQYVEFFGKFYDAGGKAFKPFKTANKYIKVKPGN